MNAIDFENDSGHTLVKPFDRDKQYFSHDFDAEIESHIETVCRSTLDSH